MPNCKCGCGEWTSNTYVYNHHRRGSTLTVSEETRQRISESNLGKVLSEETKEKIRQAQLGNIYRRGSTTSNEARENIRKNRLGRVHSEEAREKMREAKLGNTHFLGKSHSDKARENMRKVALGNTNRLGTTTSDEVIQRMRKAKLGSTVSDETREKTRQALLGRQFSDEARENISSGAKKLWQDPEHVKMMVKAQHKKPTLPEQRMIALIEEYDLPFVYNGDSGNFSIMGKVPDFVCTDNSFRLIEVDGDYWHQNIEREEAKKRTYSEAGYSCLFIYSSNLKVTANYEILDWLEKLKEGEHIEVDRF